MFVVYVPMCVFVLQLGGAFVHHSCCDHLHLSVLALL